jgi:hypothetical protein
MSVRNALVLFLALSTLALLVGCGSSSPSAQAPPGGGFSASNFSGTYVISIAGFDYASSTSVPDGSTFALAGVISPNGSGSIQSGTVDIYDPALAGLANSTTFFQPAVPVTGSYRMTQDGRGSGTISFTFDDQNEQFGIDFVITAGGQGLITRFDSGGSGSGTLDLQTSTSQSALSSVAFTLSGVDSLGNSLATVGGGTLDTSTGTITAGSVDFNDGRSSTGLTNIGLTGSVVIASGTSGTATLSSAFGALGFDVFVINSSHLKLIETDSTGNILSGDAYAQQTSISAGNLAYTLGGLDGVGSGDPVTAGGLLAIDASGDISGFEDFVDSGTSTSGTQTITSGNCTLSSGRCQISPGGFTNGSLGTFEFAAYPSNSGILLLEVDGLGQLLGAAYPQSSTALSTPQGYGLNLTGFDLSSGAEVDDIAEFTAQNVGSNGSGSLSGIIDINDAGTFPGSGLGSSSYTPDSPADGRGSITFGNSNILPAGLEYYTIDGSNALLIESDGNQISLGTMQLQDASTSPSALGPAMNLLRQASMAHPNRKQRKKANNK